MEKFWILQLTSSELTIVKLAVEKYVNQYTNNGWTREELESTLNVVNNPKHRAL